MTIRQKLRSVLDYLKPGYGRLNRSEAAAFGEGLIHGFGYIGAGPVLVVFNLPARFRKHDRQARVLTLGDLNTALREAPLGTRDYLPN